MKPLSLTDSIVKTLGYSGIFNFPLTREELYPRLLYKKVSYNTFTSELDNLIDSGKILTKNNYLARRNIDKLVASRRRRVVHSERKLMLARARARALSLHPNIRAIFATGSLAVENSTASDDIDLLVVTRASRLWQTRLLITPLLDLVGTRRRPESKDSRDLLCLNIYLTTSSLVLPEYMRNIYSAYELIQARPLIDKSTISSDLLLENSWISEFLPNFPLPKIRRNKTKLPTSRPSPIETFAYRFQRSYMAERLTNETIGENFAFFHPRPLAPDIISKLERIK